MCLDQCVPLMYSCESWLTSNIKVIEKQYNKIIRSLLGIRKITSPNLCMLEAGIVPIKEIIRRNQKSFLIGKRENFDKDLPFNYVYNMCRNCGTPGFRFLSNILEENSETDPLQRVAREVRDRSANATKLNTYITELNPYLEFINYILLLNTSLIIINVLQSLFFLV